jgi:hypothetical protein
MKLIWIGGLAATFALAFEAGYKVGEPSLNRPSVEVIKKAQANSFFGATPEWLGLTDNPAVFKGLRDRGYAFCFSEGKISESCARAQDDAVQSSILALYVAYDQQKMKDKSVLGQKERHVAENPEIIPRVLNECWQLYKAHGGQDVRILAVCLGNLTDFSPLISLPVT